ncbi:MAG: hypothetical protein WCD70_01390 [Alphaproteobacteria bacterium]
MSNIERNGVFYEVANNLVTGRVLATTGEPVAFSPDLEGVKAEDLVARFDKLDFGQRFIGAVYEYAAKLRGNAGPKPG